VIKFMKKLFTFASLVLFSTSIFAQDRIALVIGNSDYEINPLENPVNDAQDIAKVLTSLDFRVTLVMNADKRDMKDAIYNFSDQLNKDTVGLFYFAGHAAQYQGENYLIPVNALKQITKSRYLEDEAVRSGIITREMSASESQLNFLILDACRDNPLPSDSRGIKQGLARSQDAKGTLIAYSTSPGSTAEDGLGRNSPYTNNLLKFIETPNQPVELMLKDVKDAVSNDTNGNQLPWYESSITGNFCFNSVNNGCAKAVSNVLDNPFLDGLYDLEVLTSENGDRYIGQVLNGQFNGKGVLTYKNGTIYQGDFKNNQKHGNGLLTQLNGSSYSGSFIDDQKHGYGVLSWINGASMETEWLDGERVYAVEPSYKGGYDLLFRYNGSGTYIFPSGAYYTGEFEKGMFNGNGTYIDKNGNMYVGEFTENKRTGEGVFYLVNGDKYEGSFINGSLSGAGIYTSLNGQSYFGNFRNNKFHGLGELSINGIVSNGEFIDGKLNGVGTKVWANGTVYKGEFMDGQQHGNGTINFHNGDFFKGQFDKGLRNGFGEIKWANGESYEGDWFQGKRHGYGTIKWANGSSYRGSFAYNFMNEKGIFTDTKKANYHVKHYLGEPLEKYLID